MSTQSKVYSRRDSVTAILKKLGVDREHYGKFIHVASGGFTYSQAEVEKWIASQSAPKTKTKTKPAPKPGEKAVRANGRKRLELSNGDTVSSMARKLILAGHSNEEVFAELKERFNLNDNKRHYPSWYRAELRRTGQIA